MVVFVWCGGQWPCDCGVGPGNLDFRASVEGWAFMCDGCWLVVMCWRLLALQVRISRVSGEQVESSCVMVLVGGWRANGLVFVSFGFPGLAFRGWPHVWWLLVG